MRIDLQLDKSCNNVYGMQYLLINFKNLHADISASMQFVMREFKKLGVLDYLQLAKHWRIAKTLGMWLNKSDNQSVIG